MSLDLAASAQPGAVPEGGLDSVDRVERAALRRCTAVDLDEFATRIWSREASLSRAAQLPSGFGDLFTLDDADRLLSQQGLRTPFLRVARNGSTLPPARFTTGGGVGATVGDQVSDVKLTQLFADGATIVLQALHRTHGPVIDFAQALGGDLGHPVQVNAYLTPVQSQGFSAHYDVHDVFVLQISGRKRWRIHAPVLPAPLRDQPWTDHRAAVEAAAAQAPLIDVELAPGDALYLPRGYLHSAAALGEPTAHLTLGVHVWTRRHLLESILAATADDPELRSSLPLGVDLTDADDLQGELERTIAALTRRLGGLSASDLLPRLAGQALTSAKAAPVGPLAQSAAAARVTLADRLRWRPALHVTVEDAAEPSSSGRGPGRAGSSEPSAPELLVHTPDGDVRLPRDGHPALDRLQAGEVLQVTQLHPDADSAHDLARRLLRACLVVPA